MARAFYNYTLTILEKVSFDPELFVKELQKAQASLLPHEQVELNLWLKKFLINKPDLKIYVTNKELFGNTKQMNIY